VWQLLQEIVPGRCTAASTQGVDVPRATGKKMWLKLVAGSPFGWQLRPARCVGWYSGDLEESVPGDDLVHRFAVTAAAGLLLEICRPRSVGPDRAVTRQARHLVMDGSGADTERRVRRDRRHMVWGASSPPRSEPASRRGISSRVRMSRPRS